MPSLTILSRLGQLGIAGGLRFTFPLAAFSRAASVLPPESQTQPQFALLSRAPVPTILAVAALGEALGDKLPFVPPRTNSGPLLGRMVGTGVIGGLVAMAEGEPFALGAGVSSVTAGWASFAATSGRAALGALGMPGVVIGLVEDALAAVLALGAVSPMGSKVA